MPTKTHKLDIFKVLGQISSKNKNYFSELTEEEQKALQPLVVMRWLTGTKSAQQIYFMNELVNPFIFSLANHKELLVDLMTICGPGRGQRYYWNKANNKKSTKMPTVVKVIQQYFRYSSSNAIDAIPLLTDDTILSYADDLGFQPDEIRLIKKELKTRK